MLNIKPIKRILLINPPIEDFYQTEIRQQPLGLNYIQASLEQAGFEPILLDCLASNKRKTISIPQQLSYVKTFYPIDDLSPFRLFTHFYHFGLDFSEIKNQIAQLQPDLIGVSVNFTPYVEMALETARLCKTTFPLTPIVAGGHHGTAAPDGLLHSGYFDFIILGEGEQRIIKLIHFLNKNSGAKPVDLEGIAFRDGDKIIVNPAKEMIADIDSLPRPKTRSEIKPIITSRGCPKNCNFCSIAEVMGKKIRYRSIESVVEDIKIGIVQGVKKFDFEDDNLTANLKRAKHLFQQIIDTFAAHNLTLSAMNGILADNVDQELVRLMKMAGFQWLNIPLVSGDCETQKKINRYQSKQQFLNVIQWAHDNGLKTVAYLILGLPEDSLNQMLNDIVHLASLPVLIGPSVFYPPPGSVTFDNCLAKKYITGEDMLLYRSTAFPVETENFSRLDLATLFRLVRMINYVKNIIDQFLDKDENLLEYFAPKNSLSEKIVADKKLTPDKIGNMLVGLFFRKHQLAGIKFVNSTENKFEYKLFDYQISRKVVEMFLNKLIGRKISGTAKTVGLIC